MQKFFLPLLLCLCSVLTFTGCFVPNKYLATLTLTEKNYAFEFIGEMRMAGLYSKKVQDDPAWDKQKLAQQILGEFTRVLRERMPDIFELRSVTPDLFQTKFTYTSPYALPEAVGLFNFHIEGKRLTITSRHINAEEHAMLKKYEIPSQGTLCIKTFGKVVQSNAHSPANILQQCSTWHMKNLDEGIKMIIDFPNELVAP